MMILARDLLDSQCGRPAAILGGGPSLPADLARLGDPEDIKSLRYNCLLISANQHALRLVKAGYMVFLDDPYKHPPLLKAVQSFDGARVTRSEDWADILLGSETRWWIQQLTGQAAAWFGLWLGCDPVLLCGMDCYQGGERYFYDRSSEPRSWTQRATLAGHLKGWTELARRAPHVERVKAMSGPLGKVFGYYKEQELHHKEH